MGLLPTHASDWLAFIEPPEVSRYRLALEEREGEGLALGSQRTKVGGMIELC